MTLIRGQHGAVFSPTLLKEWRKHRSRFATQWLTSMTARKKVIRISLAEDTIKSRVEKICPGSRLEAALKDCHLLHAALATDRSVISLDETVRKIYGSLSNDILELREIVWVNPTLEAETPIEWLEHGAQHERHRKLGRQGQ